MSKQSAKIAVRARLESAFGAASPEVWQEWNVADPPGTGGVDLVVTQDSTPLFSKTPQIYATPKSGTSSLNTIKPVPGSRDGALGSAELFVIPELMDVIFTHIFGERVAVESAGALALAATAWGGTGVALDTQSAGTEQLKFSIASASVVTSASIDIIQNSVTVETITLVDNGSPTDPFIVYSKGAYDGVLGAITLDLNGTVTDGMVTVSGVQFVTVTYKKPLDIDTIPPTLVIQQIGRIEAGEGGGKGAQFFTGCLIPTMSLAFDRTTTDNLVMATVDLMGVFPTIADPVPYLEDAGKHYHVLPGWNGVFKIGNPLVNFCKLNSGEFQINSNNLHDQLQCSTQNPFGFTPGLMESTGTIAGLFSDDTRLLQYEGSQDLPAQMLFESTSFIHNTTPWSIAINMEEWTIEDYTPEDQLPAQAVSLTYRSIANDVNAGPVSVIMVMRKAVV